MRNLADVTEERLASDGYGNGSLRALVEGDPHWTRLKTTLIAMEFLVSWGSWRSIAYWFVASGIIGFFFFVFDEWSRIDP